MLLLIALTVVGGGLTPTPEAESFGVRLARTGMLATLLPMMVAKDTAELVAEQKALSDADKTQLRAVAADRAKEEIERVMVVEGHAYATSLSLEDLKTLVSFNETAVSGRFRAAQPKVIGATMQGLAGIDFKKDVLTAFCKQTGKGCPAK